MKQNIIESPILEINDLVVHYETDEGVAEAINGLNLRLEKGCALGLVGETGAGKTSVALSIMGLLPFPPSHIIRGEILFDGENLLEKSSHEMRAIRGEKISMIFQDPMTALNPVMTVGDQVAEVISLHTHIKKSEAIKKATDMLELVGIPGERYTEYPHQFSGGMKQRVVIAVALACNPQLLIADEPTTALDVTIQAQVLELMKDLKEKLDSSLLLITHDFGVVADICDYCAVMYAGEIVEYGSLEQVFNDARHPYTQGLFAALPSLTAEVERLKSIPGLMSDPMLLPNWCSFYDRCEHACPDCKNGDPSVIDVGGGHLVKCRRIEKKEAGAP